MGEMSYQDQSVWEESVSAVTLSNSIELGVRRYYKGEEYVYCYNAGGAACDKLDGVKLVTGTSGYSVAATSLTDTANPCVGVVKNATMTAAAYGWVMSKGFSSVNMVSAATGDYVAIALGAGGSFIHASPVTDAAGVGTQAAVGYLLDSDTGAGGASYAFIKTGF